jgi:hypothetical protein
VQPKPLENPSTSSKIAITSFFPTKSNSGLLSENDSNYDLFTNQCLLNNDFTMLCKAVHTPKCLSLWVTHSSVERPAQTSKEELLCETNTPKNTPFQHLRHLMYCQVLEEHVSLIQPFNHLSLGRTPLTSTERSDVYFFYPLLPTSCLSSTLL